MTSSTSGATRCPARAGAPRGRGHWRSNALDRAASALCRPSPPTRRGAGGARSGGPPRRRAARSRAALELIAQLVGDAGGEPFDLQHHAGERLADLVVQLTRDPLALGLLDRQRLASAVTALGLEPVEHVVERLRQRDDARVAGHLGTHAGASGSWWRIVSARSSRGANAGRKKTTLAASSATRPAARMTSSLGADRHRHGDGREHEPAEREQQHARVGREHAPEQGQSRPCDDASPVASHPRHRSGMGSARRGICGHDRIVKPAGGWVMVDARPR